MSRENCEPIGDYIRKVEERNTEDKKDNLLGVSVSKVFMKSIANTVGPDFIIYRLVKRNQFTYIPDTSRRGDKMQALVERYNDRDENDILRSEVYEEMAEQLTSLICEVHKEFSAGDALGIDFEEKAFYDILKELCIRHDFTYPEDKLIELAKAVKEVEIFEQAENFKKNQK